MWYDDKMLVDVLPLRYRAYAAYSRLSGSRGSRRVAGGSFLLRILRRFSQLFGLDSVVPIRGMDGLVVYADFNDERILDVIYEIRGEDPEYRVMSGILEPGDTFVDIGANFGTFSLLASRLVGPAGKVIAIEPQPGMADLISKSLGASKVSNCDVRQAACGSERGKMELLIPRNDSGRAGFFESFSGRPGHQRVSVETMLLDDLFDSHHIDRRVMVKLDVEGSESSVLEGGRRFIESLHPPLMIEINPWTASAAGSDTAALMDLLVSLGYRRFATMDLFPESVTAGEVPLDKQSNVIARY